MKKIIQFIVLFPILCFSQGNSIKITTYTVPTTDGINVVGSGQVQDDMKIVDISHLDGFGRPIQVVGHKQSQSGNDLITAIEYDILGQKEKQYLPFASYTSSQNYTDNATVIANTETYYSTMFDDGQNPYYQTRHEKSHLNRVVEQSSPGTDWLMNATQDNDHTTKITYRLSDQSTYESVKVFTSFSTWEASTQTYTTQLTNAGTTTYGSEQLYATAIRNENWTSGKLNSTIEFTNAKGQILLRRTFIDKDVNVDTYYVYDQFDNLTFVIPPAATETIDTEVLNNLCYQYLYDHRKRQIMKKLPGKQWQYIVYDVLDRQVAIGPANSPFGNNKQGWLVTKYDAFGRIAYTGWFEEKEITKVERLYYSQQLGTDLWEERTPTGHTDNILTGYSNRIHPRDFKLLTINYYDNYEYPLGMPVPDEIENQHVSLNVMGLQTGRWVRILTTPESTKNKFSYTYYDEKARILRIRAFRNDTDGYTQIDNNLDFTGRVNYCITLHKRSASVNEIYIRDRFKYDAQRRIVLQAHKIGLNGTEQLLSLNTYNDFGQLVNKKTGGTDIAGISAYQSINYKYTIRGWLKSINDPDEFLTDHFFALKLNYNTTEDVENEYEGEKLFNGNISEAYWRTSTDNVERKYGYFYDEMNRIKDAVYQKKVDPHTTLVTNSYNESITYDLNGNIESLLRNGYLDADNGTTVLIDKLSYKYLQDSNQLQSVDDHTGFIDGFYDSNSGSPDYEFDTKGNLFSDENKGIVSITYNHLNLPTRIEFNNSYSIEYTYDALGTKLKREIFGGRRNTIEYRDGFQYKGTTLQFFPTSEGYVNVTNSNGETIYNYIFHYKDHLGNIRLSYADIKEMVILQENHYYPFGLKHENYNAQTYEIDTTNDGYEVILEQVQRPDYQYKYNGKEWQDELNLNMTAMDFRQYDNALGRFVCIDPLSELDYGVSPYAFGRNNPIVYKDPTGLCPVCEDRVDERGYEADGGESMKVGDADYSFNEIAGQWERVDTLDDLHEVEVIAYGKDDDKFGRLDKDDDSEFLYDYGDGVNQLINAGTVVWGATELGAAKLATAGGNALSKFSGANARNITSALSKTGAIVGKIGTAAGLVGYGISAVSITTKLANGETIKTSEAVGFGVSTALLVGGAVVAGTAAAPFVAAAALVYGAAELISYATTGQSLEQLYFND